MTHDPRRIVVTFHSNSSNPRARRWYSIEVACEFDGQLWPHKSLGIAYEARRRRADANKVARTYARTLGHPFKPGLWQGHHGQPMTREA